MRDIETARYRIGQLHRRMLPGAAVMMEMITGAWCAQAITAAADLGIADALANGPLTARELAAAIDADADTVSRLLRALISRGIFRQRRDGRYDLKNVIHDWPDDDPLKILSNVRTAAGIGKHVLLVECVIPRHGREFLGKWMDLEMLVCAAGRERTADEYGLLLERAGFHLTRVVETASPFSGVEAIAI